MKPTIILVASISLQQHRLLTREDYCSPEIILTDSLDMPDNLIIWDRVFLSDRNRVNN